MRPAVVSMLIVFFAAAQASAADPVLPDRVTALLQLVDEGHESQWSIACETLIAIGPTARPAVKPLLALAVDTRRDPERRIDAMRAAAALAPDDSAIYRTLITLIADPQNDVRWTSADQLRRLYSHRPDVAALAVPVLVASWKKYRDIETLYLGDALYDFGPMSAPATGELIAMLAPPEEPDPKLPDYQRESIRRQRLRSMQAKVLGRIGAPAQAAIPAIAAMLESKEKYERSSAVEALADFGPLAKAASPALVKATEDADPGVRYRAMYALARVGFADTASLPAFKNPQKPDAATLRFGYVVGEAVSGPKPLPQLLEAIKSLDRMVSSHASNEAKKISKAMVPELIAALRMKDRRKRWAAASLIGTLGGRVYLTGAGAAFWNSADGRAAEAALIELMSDPDHYARSAGAIHIMSARSGRSLAALREMARSLDWYDRSNALVALGDFRGTVFATAALETLRAAMDDPNAHVRFAAVATLGEFGPAARDAVPRLIAALDDDGRSAPFEWPPLPTDATPEEIEFYKAWTADALPFYTGVSGSAVRTLAKIGPDARAAIPAMAKRLRGIDAGWFHIPDYHNRRAEIQVLGSIGPEAAETIPLILKRLPLDGYAYYSLDEIGRMGERGAAALVPFLRTRGQSSYSYHAKEVLAKMGRPAAVVMLPVLKNPDDPGRSDAWEAVMTMDVRASPASAVLAAHWVSGGSLPFDPRLKAIGQPMVTALADLLPKATPNQRARICEAIVTFPTEDAVLAVPTLIELLEIRNQTSRIGAAKALGKIGPPARASLPALRKLAAEGSDAEKDAALSAAITVGRSPG